MKQSHTASRMKAGLRIVLASAFLLSMFAVLLPVDAVSAAPASDNVWINEIHYDNDGADVGEGVEIAGDAGVDLTGWSLVPYNGNGGGSYTVTALSGTLTDAGSGVGFINFAISGLQNGSPDGVALVDDLGTVVQFLSYEGSFTATDGAASGMTSTDIGVAETSSTAVGDSLQLSGTGCAYADFTWQAPAVATVAAVNTGQTISCSVEVWINEIHYDNDGADVGEGVEIAGDAGVDLTGWSLVPYNGNGGGSYSDTALSGTITDAGSGVGFINFAISGLQNGSPDGVALVDDLGTVVQFLSYEGSFTATDGAASGMTSTDIGVSEPSSTTVGDSLQLSGTGCAYADFSWQAPAVATVGAVNTGQTISCGAVVDNAPTVTSTTPADSDTGVALDSDITINFSEDVAVATDWVGIECATSGTVAFTETAGPASSFTLNPDADFVNDEVCTVTVDASSVTDQDDTPDNMAVDYVFSFTTDLGPQCGQPATLISTVQGSDVSASPLVGTDVTIEGVVVATYQGTDELDGFMVQEEDSDADGDPLSSEGVFVYHMGDTVTVGDVVRLTGTVDEYYDNTQIKTITDFETCSTGNTLPTPASLALPLTATDDLEDVEGMLVTFAETLYVTETYNLGRYGEVSLSGTGILNNPTNVAEPGAPAIALAAANDLNRILLDDANGNQNPEPVEHLGPSGATLRLGDSVTGLTGAIYYSYGTYRVEPVGDVTFVEGVRPEAAPNVGGTLKVASFNVLNYFTTLGSRGADTTEEFTRQRDKIINALILMDADVVGLMEIENHITDDAVNDLVDGLNAVAGAGTYAAISTGVIGTDEIKQAIIYKPATVTPTGAFAILDSTVDPTFLDTKNRPVLAQTFTEVASGEVFTVAVNHLKSKGSDCLDIGDADLGDGQGNCPATRTSAATALVNWLATDPTSSGDTDFLIIGDLNAYAKEDPVDAIIAGGYTDLVDSFGGGSQLFSYVYDGEVGYLDHALSSASLTGSVTGATFWHINADEPRILDYNTEYNPASLYVADQYRSSDHNPVLIGLNLSGVPILIGPPTGHTTTDHTPNFDWEDVPGATAYVIQVSPTDDFSVLPIVHTVTPSFFAPGMAINNQQYWWRVNAIVDGSLTGWSEVRTITVTGAPGNPQPVAVSPADGATTSNHFPTFDWEDVPGAVRYRIQISLLPGFGTWVVNQTVTDSEFTPGVWMNSNTYYWRVQAEGGGDASWWSIKRQLIISDLP